MAISSSGRAFLFWKEPQSVKESRQRKQREYDVSKILKEASENKDAFERVVDNVCFMIVEKIEAGKRIEENFSLKIQSIIEGLRGLAWPKDQASYTTKASTSSNPTKWIETLKELKSLSYRIDENKLSHPQN